MIKQITYWMEIFTNNMSHKQHIKNSQNSVIKKKIGKKDLNKYFTKKKKEIY